MGVPRVKKSSKNPPFFSHEFVIQNHADIVSCVVMVFILGLMFPATAGLVSKFVVLQHNVTINATETMPEITGLYMYGKSDMLSVLFYGLITIICHAVVQEYVLDKLNRKMHLSKIKHSKFNESGQLLIYYVVSVLAALDIIIRQQYIMSVNQLWEDYPHANLPFMVKFYFICQIAYWLHTFPELYFQRVKKDDMVTRLPYICMYLVFIIGAYTLNLTRVALCMLTIHFLVEIVFHASRLLHFSEKDASKGFMVWNVLFVLVRLASITLSVLTFWYGLQIYSQPSIDWRSGNFNTQLIRINCLAATCLVQAWMMWNFITFHLKRMRERATTAKRHSPKKIKKSKAGSDEEVNSLPEVDQREATENGVRSRRTGSDEEVNSLPEVDQREATENGVRSRRSKRTS